MRYWKTKTPLLDIALVLVTFSYPFIVYFGLKTLPAWIIGLGLIVFLLVRMLLSKKRKKSEFLIFSLVLAMTGVLFLIDHSLAIKSYPILMNISFAMVFGYSLLYPPTIIERIARLREPDLDARGVRYTQKVTIAWVVFFVANGAVSAWTAVYGSLELWTIYNGFISYILIGLMFGFEFIIRLFVKQKKVS
ncbi:hypothetical protein NBZ79_06450 [Sneathiella marina]|uniref:DNA gyrase subunit B n=1 Tax=Sneathiella marina TaxID=2950108 RepID=A0ABY4W607_9PROT|nr:hypothetical protein [Sneathiella marina]USG62615.1 hypothetical protein NBZ79_06450 [Sneathiella marina]